MNYRDHKAVVEAIKNVLAQAGEPRKPVVAFDVSLLTGRLRNVRRNKMIEEVNDLLSCTSVCVELEGLFTICEFEGNAYFLIQANLAHSVYEHFVPEEKDMTKGSTTRRINPAAFVASLHPAATDDAEEDGDEDDTEEDGYEDVDVDAEDPPALPTRKPKPSL